MRSSFVATVMRSFRSTCTGSAGTAAGAGTRAKSRRARSRGVAFSRQGIVLVLSDRLVKAFPTLATGRGAEVMQTLLVANFAIIGLNLLPIPFLDGLQAWQLFRWANVVAFARWVAGLPRSLYLRVRLRRLSRRAKHVRSISSHRDWMN